MSYNLARIEMVWCFQIFCLQIFPPLIVTICTFDVLQFIIPASLSDGWVCYVWDMKRKSIHVLDPQNLREMAEDHRSMNEYVSSVLHMSLSSCLA